MGPELRSFVLIEAFCLEDRTGLPMAMELSEIRIID